MTIKELIPKHSNKELFLTFLITYVSFSWIPDSGASWVKLISFAITAGVALLCIKSRSGIGIKKAVLPYVVTFYVIAFIAFLIHNRLDEISLIIKLTLVCLLLAALKIDVFLTCVVGLSKVIFFPTVFGLICSIYGVNFRIPESLILSDKVYYITPFFTVQRTLFESRAYSIFWEPGIFACFANIVLAIRLFRNDERLRFCWREFFYIALAQSIGGMLSLAVLLVAYFAKRNRIVDRCVFASGVWVAVLLSLNFSERFDDLTNVVSFFTESIFSRNLTVDESFAARSIDFYLPFSIAMGSPFIGFSNIDEFVKIATNIRGQSALIITNSWGLIAYFYGFIFLAMYAAAAIVGVRKLGFGRSYILIFWFYILLTSAPVHTTIFILLFLLLLIGDRPSDHE